MTRHYIFEDRLDDDIQRLFSVPYGGYEHASAHNLHWANGHSNIIQNEMAKIYSSLGIDITILKPLKPKVLKRLSEEEKEKRKESIEECKVKLAAIYDDIEIYIFMDLVPDNAFTADVYTELKGLKDAGCNILVFPIPCAEYYMIKTLCDLQIIPRTEDINIVLNRGIYYTSSLLDDPQSQDYIRNFEKYCKIVFLTISKLCLHKSSEEDKDREQNNLKGRFYRTDCKCEDCSFSYSLQQKAEELLHRYPCIPLGAYMIFYKTKVLSRKELIALHNKLVTEYNSAVDTYSSYTGSSKLKNPKSQGDFKTIESME